MCGNVLRIRPTQPKLVSSVEWLIQTNSPILSYNNDKVVKMKKQVTLCTSW